MKKREDEIVLEHHHSHFRYFLVGKPKLDLSPELIFDI
jgi:hypothetical protein